MSDVPGKRVVLAGGSGFLGRLLAQRLDAFDYDVVVLTRSEAARIGGARAVPWDGKTLGDWSGEIDGAEALINLTGKSVDCRPTEANRREILSSRLDSVRVLAEAVSRMGVAPKSWIQSSSLAIYGDAGERVCHDDAPMGDGFGAEVCKRWEDAFQQLEAPSVRKAVFRIGAVMGPDGVAMRKLLRLTKLFLGGTVGSGRQWISWLHPADMTEMFRWAIEHPAMEGIFNATSPNPITNAELMREIRRAAGRPWSPPTPAFAVRLAAPIIGTDPEIPLTGRRCLPRRLIDLGFEFKHPHIREALADVL